MIRLYRRVVFAITCTDQWLRTGMCIKKVKRVNFDFMLI